jgi:phosphoglycolate phosphatase-like HAD superfamily hydrolase
MKNNCFIDFDGTLVSNKKRLYQFFIDFIPDKYKEVISIDDFWTLKTLGISELDWINNTLNINLDKTEFSIQKKERIEDFKYLKLDEVFTFSKEKLIDLKAMFNIILITRRSNSINLIKELEFFNLKKLFDDILILSHNNETKASLIKQKYCLNEGDILIGDTEDDIVSGIELGLKTFLVKSGIRKEWILYKYNLNYKVNLIDSLADIPLK